MHARGNRHHHLHCNLLLALKLHNSAPSCQFESVFFWVFGEITEESAVDVEKRSFDSGLLGDDAYARVEQPRHAVQDAPQLAKVLVPVIPSHTDIGLQKN